MPESVKNTGLVLILILLIVLFRELGRVSYLEQQTNGITLRMILFAFFSLLSLVACVLVFLILVYSQIA